MNDHELCKYIKENYEVEKDRSLVLVINFFNPEPQFKEHYFTCERKKDTFIYGLRRDSVYAHIRYYENEIIFCFEGRLYTGSENLTTGEIYEWRLIHPVEGEATPEQLRAELQQLIEFLNKKAS